MAVPVPQNVQATGQPLATLYVGDLLPRCIESDLFEVFNAIGPVQSIRVCRDSVSRKSLGYAYVNFVSAEDAERALDALNYTPILGKNCRIMWSSRDGSFRKAGEGNVFVKNLDRNIDNKSLFDTFSLFGNILSCKVATDAAGKSKGYGFVHYETVDSAKTAIEKVNGMMIGEKQVFVGPFVKKEAREPHEKPFSNVYVKNIPAEWTEDTLKSKFAEFGQITSMLMKQDKEGRAFAFINYADFDEAKAAVAKMHGQDFRTEEQKASTPADADPDSYLLYAQRAQTKAERAAEFAAKAAAPVPAPTVELVNLYIKNLDDTIDDEKLREVFAPFGTITSARVMVDATGRSKGFGFVCFSSPDEATQAVTEMHLKLVGSKPLYVGLAEKKELRQQRLAERFRNVGPRGPGPMGGQPVMYQTPGMQPGVRPQMGNMQMMQNWARPRAMMGMNRPPMAMNNYMGMYQRPPMMAGARPGMVPGGVRPGPMFRFTPQARNQQAPQQAYTGPPAPEAPYDPSMPLTAATLAAAAPGMQKQMLGERLFPMIAKFQPELAGKITGMMLEMDNSEILILLESETQLKSKIDEALRVIDMSAK